MYFCSKFNIRNPDKLEQVERVICGARLIDLYKNPLKGTFDFKKLKKIHFHLFNDIYDWAGEIRTCNISKKDVLFCNAQYIESSAKQIFLKLKEENFLKNLSQEEICERGAYYMCEINCLHPFREGNGRAQREFMRQLFLENEFKLNYEYTNVQEMITASVAGMVGDYSLMKAILKRCTMPIQP